MFRYHTWIYFADSENTVTQDSEKTIPQDSEKTATMLQREDYITRQ